jgi:hypothetical protein
LVWTVRYVLMLVVLIDAREIKRLESLRSAIYIKHLASTAFVKARLGKFKGNLKIYLQNFHNGFFLRFAIF